MYKVLSIPKMEKIKKTDVLNVYSFMGTDRRNSFLLE